MPINQYIEKAAALKLKGFQYLPTKQLVYGIAAERKTAIAPRLNWFKCFATLFVP